ncbi:MAG: Nif3-like dinuclear metal center hexameric protein [Tepidisphaerales bacterium]
MHTVRDVVTELDRLAPTSLAEPWDNVGLLVGDPDAEVTHVLLTIDLTPAVLEEAVAQRCGLIVAYHPPIFDPVKRLLAGDLAFDAARRGVAIYSPHTALDAAAGGTNDTLAAALGLTDLRPLRPVHRPLPPPRLIKLVTYVPAEAVAAVADAIFRAGAGHIGNYSHCSFRAAGTGTFLGHEGTNPTVGQPGKLEEAPELRWETIVPADRLPQAVAALRLAHPYEEPAFDLIPLLDPAAVPSAEAAGQLGLGRVGKVPVPVTVGDLVGRLKASLGMSNLIVGRTPAGLAAPVDTVAICAGAGRSLVPDVLASNAQVYLTGELPHHDVLKLLRAGVCPLLTLHSNSERPALGPLGAQLEARLPGLTALLSEVDADPLEIV